MSVRECKVLLSLQYELQPPLAGVSKPGLGEATSNLAKTLDSGFWIHWVYSFTSCPMQGIGLQQWYQIWLHTSNTSYHLYCYLG